MKQSYGGPASRVYPSNQMAFPFWLNLWYQLNHPWHWLTYGQNASGLGFVLLFFYTVYTRKMMLEAERARRGAMVPRLAIVGGSETPSTFEMEIANVGGPALEVEVFRLEGLNNFRYAPQGLKVHDLPSLLYQSFLLRDQDAIKIPIKAPKRFVHTAYVVQCTDTFNERHQLVVSLKWIRDDAFTTSQKWLQPEVYSRNFLPLMLRRALFPFGRTVLQYKTLRNRIRLQREAGPPQSKQE